MPDPGLMGEYGGGMEPEKQAPTLIPVGQGYAVKAPLVFGDKEQLAIIKKAEAEIERKERVCGECDGEGQIICPNCTGSGERRT